MQEPYLSIVMPTCNRAHIFKETVEAVLNSTFENFEYIIVDDASTDNTFDILRNIKDSRIKIYRNSNNKNCSYCNHLGQNLAKGKYIAHIDDDDIISPNKFEKQLNYLEANKSIKLIGTFIETFGENKRPSWVFYKDPPIIDFVMTFYNPLCHSSIIYDRLFAKENNINYDINYRCSQDYELYKQFILKGGLVANIDEVLCKYRMHKIRLTDVHETGEIMTLESEKVKKDLLKRFLNEDEVIKVRELLKDFPFDNYRTEDVEKAFEIISAGNTKAKLYNPEVIEFVLNDIRNGRFKF